MEFLKLVLANPIETVIIIAVSGYVLRRLIKAIKGQDDE
jgi:hypothetical protein